MKDEVAGLRRRDYNTKSAFIPRKMTLFLQPLDIAINFPFKAALQNAWSHWHRQTPPIFTRKRYRIGPSYDEVVKMVGQACKEVQAETIRRAFEYCGIKKTAKWTPKRGLIIGLRSRFI
jgi:hypothetical protein